MKKCSYCGRDNDDVATHCRECGTELAEPEARPVDPELLDPTLDLVIVGTFRTVVDATMAKSRLEAAGIESCVPEEYSPQILWCAIPSPLERVTLRVAAKDVEAAREILAANENPPAESGPDGFGG